MKECRGRVKRIANGVLSHVRLFPALSGGTEANAWQLASRRSLVELICMAGVESVE